MNNVLIKNLVTILMLGLLTACHEKPNIAQIETKLENKQPIQALQSSPSDTLKALDEKLSGNKVFTADEVKFDTVSYHYQPPNNIKELCNDNQENAKNTQANKNCFGVDINLAKIEPSWIEQVVNKKITSDDNPKLIKFKRNIDTFVQAYLSKLGANTTIKDTVNIDEWYVMPKMNTYHHLVQIAIYEKYQDVHDESETKISYLIFDMELQSQIFIDDVVVKENKEELKKLAYKGFKDYLKNQSTLKKKEIAGYDNLHSFKISENFYFNDVGLILVYSPKEFKLPTQEMIEIAIPFDKLLGNDTGKTLLQSPYLFDNVSTKSG